MGVSERQWASVSVNEQHNNNTGHSAHTNTRQGSVQVDKAHRPHIHDKRARVPYTLQHIDSARWRTTTPDILVASGGTLCANNSASETTTSVGKEYVESLSTTSINRLVRFPCWWGLVSYENSATWFSADRTTTGNSKHLDDGSATRREKRGRGGREK